MPSSQPSVRTTFNRPAPDLVASDELLNTLLVGLAHLRARLEAARSAGTTDSGAPFSTGKSSTTKSADTQRRWFYANEPAPVRD